MNLIQYKNPKTRKELIDRIKEMFPEIIHSKSVMEKYIREFIHENREHPLLHKDLTNISIDTYLKIYRLMNENYFLISLIKIIIEMTANKENIEYAVREFKYTIRDLVKYLKENIMNYMRIIFVGNDAHCEYLLKKYSTAFNEVFSDEQFLNITPILHYSSHALDANIAANAITNKLHEILVIKASEKHKNYYKEQFHRVISEDLAIVIQKMSFSYAQKFSKSIQKDRYFNKIVYNSHIDACTWRRTLLHITKLYMDDCFPCQLLDEQLELLENDKNFKIPFNLHNVNIKDGNIRDITRVPVLIFEEIDDNASIPSDTPIKYEKIGTLVGYHQKDEIIGYIKDILKIKGYSYDR